MTTTRDLTYIEAEPADDFTRRLASLLAAYELDEPHEPGEPREGRYRLMPWPEIAAGLTAPHDGDCTDEPAACLRCACEIWTHKAKWIAARLNDPTSVAIVADDDRRRGYWRYRGKRQ